MTRTSKHLITAAMLLVLIPNAVPHSFLSFGARVWIGYTIFAVNLAVSGYGAIRGEYRAAWITYAIACALSLVLIGATDPISAFLSLIQVRVPFI